MPEETGPTSIFRAWVQVWKGEGLVLAPEALPGNETRSQVCEPRGHHHHLRMQSDQGQTGGGDEEVDGGASCPQVEVFE